MITIHIGKIPAAIPFLIEALELDLFWASTIVSAFGLLMGMLGMFMGIFADKLGHNRAAVSGLFICGLAALAGSLTESLPILLLTRIIEGLGYVLAVVSLPSLIANAATEHDKPIALGIWGAYFPAGMASMLLISPLLIAGINWQGLWAVSGLITLFWGFIVMSTFRNRPSPVRERAPLGEAFRLTTRKGPLLLFGCFTAYSSQFLAVTSFLPIMLIEIYTISVQKAATLGALVVAGNIVGNVLSGWLLRHGFSRVILLGTTATLMACCTLILFSDLFSLNARVAAAFVFTAVGGVIPGTLSASVPYFIDRPGQMASVVGLLMQGAGIGQMFGPLLLTAVVDGLGGWSFAPVYTVTVAILGVVFAGLLATVKSTGAHAA